MSFGTVLAAYIAANSSTLTGTWVVGTNIFNSSSMPVSTVHPIVPEESIWCQQTPGEEDDYLKGGRNAISYDGAIVEYRGEPGVWNAAEAQAQLLHTIVHRRTDVPGYFNVVVLTSAPARLKSQEGMARWAISVRGSKRVS